MLPKNRFARSVSILAGGTAGAQLIVILISPVLTRLYSPEDFGLLAVYAAILGILSVIASLRYELAIPVPEKQEEAANIVFLSILLVCFTTFLLSIVLWLFGAQIIDLLNAPNMNDYLWLVPLGFLLVGIYRVLQYWAIRQKAFSDIAKAKLSQSLSMVIIQVGAHSFAPVALLVGRLAGQSVALVRLVKIVIKEDDRASFRAVKKESMTNVAKRYKNFPLIGTWSGLTSSAGMNVPPLIIAAFLGASSAGLYSLAHRVLSQPMAIIGKAVSDVFYQRAAEASREGRIGEVLESVYSTLVKLAVAPAIIIFLIIPDAFLIVFGDGWLEAGEVARWMTPWLYFQFVVSSCTGIYPIIDRHDIALRFQISLFLAALLGSVVGILYFGDLVCAVIIVSALSSVVYLWRAAETFHVVGLKWSFAILIFVNALPFSILVSLPVIIAFKALESDISWLIFSTIVSFILWLYFILIPETQK